LVAHHLGIGRGFTQGGNQELGRFHAGVVLGDRAHAAMVHNPCIMVTV